ncbi:hypothetical protein A3770_10p58180 [Chloropicon primus]|uniref:RAVE complex protein Rav1 C-terminal domain-containing protein n=1 Tax=Chloropicon primus TaxID=1764295 RepID=A0A5B8MV66_9CHLO|nr:hypothetical protein A3770_10p58180 [Chloropicon primus]|eukprot:QDZ23300.1 hypothetical protein A3770_10p58180 [Chloropicon primus]
MERAMGGGAGPSAKGEVDVIVERVEENILVRSSVGGVRSTPAVCLSPTAVGSKELWLAQGTTCGTVNIFSVSLPGGRSSIAGEEDPVVRVALHFDRQIPVVSLVWNAKRRQLSVVHENRVTFFYVCIDGGKVVCTELQTFEHARPIRSLDWLALDPVVVCVDDGEGLVAYNTAQRNTRELACRGGERQTKVAVGRYLDEIATFGGEDECCARIWDSLRGSCTSKLCHSAPLRSMEWCCTSNQCILICGTSRSLCVWAKASAGKTRCYIQQCELCLDYPMTETVSLFPFHGGGMKDNALLLCREEGTLNVHRYMILLGSNHAPIISSINSLKLESEQMSPSPDLEFGAFPLLNGSHLVSLCDARFTSLWSISNRDVVVSSPRARSEVMALMHIATTKGNQANLSMVRCHAASGMILAADSEDWVHLWKVSQHEEIHLVHEFKTSSKVLDAAWGKGSPESTGSWKALILLEDTLTLVSTPASECGEVEKWDLTTKFGCSHRELVLLDLFAVSEASLRAHFSTKGGGYMSLDLEVEQRSGVREDFDPHPFPGCEGLRTAGSSHRKVTFLGDDCGLSYHLSDAKAELQLVSCSSTGGVKYPIEGWQEGCEIVTAVLSRDGCHLFISLKDFQSFKIKLWKMAGPSSVFALHSTLLTSASAVSFDVVSLPFLDPIVVACHEGKASLCNFDGLHKSWSCLLVSDRLPKEVGDVLFLSPSTLLVASNQELLTVKLETRKDGFADMGKRKLNGIQAHLIKLYHPFHVMDTSSIEECIIRGKFGLLQRQLDLIGEVLKVCDGGKRERMPVDESIVRNVYAEYCKGKGADRGFRKEYSVKGDLRMVAEIEGLLGRSKSSSPGSDLWGRILGTAKEVHERFLNAPGMSATDERLVLSYLYQSSFSSAIPTRESAPPSLSNQAKEEEKVWGLTEVDGFWGLLNKDKDLLMQLLGTLSRKFTWNEIRHSGLGYWIDSKAAAQTLFEKIAKAEFLRKRDPHDCAIFYLALKKVTVVAGLCRATNNTKLGDFLKRNFDEEANQVAALKNAYALLGQHRYELASAFFLLARKPEDAIEVCVKNLGDIQLGLCIALVQSDDERNLYTELIAGTLMPRAKEEKALHRCLLYEVMLKDKESAMETLTSMVSGEGRWSGLEACFSRAEFFHFAHLISDLYDHLGPLKNAEHAKPDSGVSFIVNYSRIVSSLGHGGLAISWSHIVSKRMSDYPDHREILSEALSDLVGKTLVSYAFLLYFVSSMSLGDLISRVEDLRCVASADLELDIPFDGAGVLGSLGGTLRIFQEGKGTGGSLADPAGGAASSATRGLGRERKKGDSSPLAVIHQFPKNVKAMKFNACDPCEATVSTSSGLVTTKLRVPVDESNVLVDKEAMYASRFPQDSWTVPIMSENSTKKPQWAILNISKADISATHLNVHPYRPLFVSNYMHDVLLLWHFHQQSAMSCYRLPQEKHKAKVSSFGFDASGEKLACTYSSGTCALFSMSSLPSNGTSIDCDACKDIFGDGDAVDITFCCQSSSVLLAAGSKGLGLWDTLQPRATNISLRKMNRPSKLYMEPKDSAYTFFCGDADGGVALFDIRRLAPVMIPLWSVRGQSLVQQQQSGMGGGQSRVLQFAGSGKMVASLHEDGKCKLWNTGLARQLGSEVVLHDSKKVTHIDAVDSGLVLCSKDGVSYKKL